MAPALELRGISKAFGPVQANKDISIAVQPGTIHGIIGENGAGKSTLISILYGFYKADAGEIFIKGEKTAIPDSQAAIAAGVGMVFQHFKLVENVTVLENIILGAEDGGLLRPSLSKARKVLRQLEQEYELHVDPDEIIENLSVGHQQRVEILKALYRQADILILDEPTGVLTPAEADQLFLILTRLREEGKTIILISHKLREIMEITDTVSVMRRGQMTTTVKTDDTTPEQLACLAGLFSERAGIFDIGLEGKMLLAAFFSAAVAYVTGSVWLGLLAGIASSMVLAGLLQAVALRYQNIDLGGVVIPVQVMDALPYILTVVILAGFVGKAIPPRAGGEPYVKER